MSFHEAEVPFAPNKDYQCSGDVILFPNGLAQIGNRTFPDRAAIEGYRFAPGYRVDRGAGERLIRIRSADGEEFRFRYSAMATKWYRQTPLGQTLAEQLKTNPDRYKVGFLNSFAINGAAFVFVRRWWCLLLWLTYALGCVILGLVRASH